MSRQTNKNNKDPKLKALLDKQAAQQQPEDSFEAEAMEGFALLDNPQEALDLKAELDERMQQGLLSEKKPAASVSSGYWMAAAGLALAVGISAYFILAGEKTAGQEMAVTSALLNYDSVAATPSAEGSFEQKNARLDSAGASYNSGASRSSRTGSGLPPAEKSQEAAALPQRAAAVAKAPAAPVEAETAGLKDHADLAFAESTEERNKGRAEEKMEETDRKADDKDAETLAKPKLKEAKKSRSQIASQSAGPSVAANGASAYQRAEKKQAADSIVANCYYEGGDKALHQLLTRRLKEKELDRHFSATLFIGANERVLKVEFTQAKEISQEEQNEISYVIQSLDQFRFRNRPAKGELTEYRISR